MKKLFTLFVALGITTAASAAPSYIKPDAKGGYDVTYNYTDKAKTGWYITGRAEVSFLNWKNKYSTDDDFAPNDKYGSDEYSFEPVFGGSLAGGYHFGYFWRGEAEAGYIGYFNDKDSAAEFTMSIPYLTANAYYDFTSGLYVGGGLGMAVPTMTIDSVFFDGSDRKKTSIVPMAALMFGYAQKLDDNLVLDIRYRLAGMTGMKQKFDFQDRYDVNHWFQNKIDTILDNSISVGIRYEF